MMRTAMVKCFTNFPECTSESDENEERKEIDFI